MKKMIQRLDALITDEFIERTLLISQNVSAIIIFVCVVTLVAVNIVRGFIRTFGAWTSAIIFLVLAGLFLYTVITSSSDSDTEERK